MDERYEVGEGMTSQVPRYHLALRLWCRVTQATSKEGCAKTVPRQLLNLAFAGLDIATWQANRRGTKRWRRWRLPLDLVDQALWSGLDPAHGDLAATIGCPTALDAGLRQGAAALAIPVAGALAGATGRRISGRPATARINAAQVVAAFGGLSARRLCHRRLDQDRQRAAQRIDAERARAYLAGQHAVAMGADSVIDALEGVAPLLGPAPEGSALHAILDAWKSSLAGQVGDHASYLGTVIAKWQSLHNLEPDLSQFVQLNLATGHGTTLLTSAQAEHLGRAFDLLDLRGPIPVAVATAQADHRPGQALLLEVGDHSISLPADPTNTVRPYSTTPAVVRCGVIWALMQADRAREAVPVPWTLPFAGAYGLASFWADREVERHGDGAAARRIVPVAIGLSLLQTVTATRASKQYVTGRGLQIYAFTNATNGLFLMLALYGDRISPALRRSALAAGLGIAAVGYMLIPRPRQPWQLVRELGFTASMCLSATGASRGIEVEAQRFGQQLALEESEAVEAAYQAGYDFVVELVDRARVDAWERLSTLGTLGDTPEAVATEARRRLSDVDQRVIALRAVSKPVAALA